jgi:hypothetical protein
MMSEPIRSFAQFWPYYLGEHGRAATRMLHLVGTTLALALSVAALITGRWGFLIGALLSGYAFAWVGHFFVEHNRPATFKHPLWSLAADFKMWWSAITGTLPGELRRAQQRP